MNRLKKGTYVLQAITVQQDLRKKYRAQSVTSILTLVLPIYHHANPAAVGLIKTA
jgi:hypothetical protein